MTRTATTATYCQRCIFDTHPSMLTGYCLPHHTCDRCGRITDCAMVRAVPTKEETAKARRKALAGEIFSWLRLRVTCITPEIERAVWDLVNLIYAGDRDG